MHHSQAIQLQLLIAVPLHFSEDKVAIINSRDRLRVLYYRNALNIAYDHLLAVVVVVVVVALIVVNSGPKAAHHRPAALINVAETLAKTGGRLAHVRRNTHFLLLRSASSDAKCTEYRGYTKTLSGKADFDLDHARAALKKYDE